MSENDSNGSNPLGSLNTLANKIERESVLVIFLLIITGVGLIIIKPDIYGLIIGLALLVVGVFFAIISYFKISKSETGKDLSKIGSEERNELAEAYSKIIEAYNKIITTNENHSTFIDNFYKKMIQECEEKFERNDNFHKEMIKKYDEKFEKIEKERDTALSSLEDMKVSKELGNTIKS